MREGSVEQAAKIGAALLFAGVVAVAAFGSGSAQILALLLAGCLLLIREYYLRIFQQLEMFVRSLSDFKDSVAESLQGLSVRVAAVESKIADVLISRPPPQAPEHIAKRAVGSYLWAGAAACLIPGLMFFAYLGFERFQTQLGEMNAELQATKAELDRTQLALTEASRQWAEDAGALETLESRINEELQFIGTQSIMAACSSLPFPGGASFQEPDRPSQSAPQQGPVKIKDSRPGPVAEDPQRAQLSPVSIPQSEPEILTFKSFEVP